jgi:hypothetical protein
LTELTLSMRCAAGWVMQASAATLSIRTYASHSEILPFQPHGCIYI